MEGLGRPGEEGGEEVGGGRQGGRSEDFEGVVMIVEGREEGRNWKGGRGRFLWS